MALGSAAEVETQLLLSSDLFKIDTSVLVDEVEHNLADK